MKASFLLEGAPRTKKTHNQLVPVGKRCGVCKRAAMRLLPSQEYLAWEAANAPLLRRAWAGCPPIAEPVRVDAVFVLQRRAGDLHGLMQGLADLLQTAGIIADDKWIESWGNSHRAHDPGAPRLEVLLTWGADLRSGPLRLPWLVMP